MSPNKKLEKIPKWSQNILRLTFQFHQLDQDANLSGLWTVFDTYWAGAHDMAPGGDGGDGGDGGPNPPPPPAPEAPVASGSSEAPAHDAVSDGAPSDVALEDIDPEAREDEDPVSGAIDSLQEALDSQPPLEEPSPGLVTVAEPIVGSIEEASAPPPASADSSLAPTSAMPSSSGSATDPAEVLQRRAEVERRIARIRSMRSYTRDVQIQSLGIGLKLQSMNPQVLLQVAMTFQTLKGLSAQTTST